MLNVKGKKILVAGLGKSGLAALDALLELGADVAVHDAKSLDNFEPELLRMLEENKIVCYLGREPKPESRFDMLVLSPGIPPETGFVKNAEENGSEIIGELELSFRIGKGNYVAVTGTNGKTTTTALIGEMFKAADRDVYVVGNIGTAVATVALKAGDGSWLVTETSSFQLETAGSFRPRVSVLLNITPDHLDRHKNMENYIEAKAKIFKNQDESDCLVVNYDDKTAYALSAGCRAKTVPFSRIAELPFGAFVAGGSIVLRDDGGKCENICGAEELLIPGRHNLENALAAAAAAYFAGIPTYVIAETLRTFSGVEHRLEFCGEIGGVRFVNDSKGTNPDAAAKAVEAVAGDVVLIAGGYDKKADFGGFIKSFGGKVKHMLLLGETADKIRGAAENAGFYDSTVLGGMEECVERAFGLAAPGDTVLLSPACASWDMYSCFEERGSHFKGCVARLGAKWQE